MVFKAINTCMRRKCWTSVDKIDRVGNGVLGDKYSYEAKKFLSLQGWLDLDWMIGLRRYQGYIKL